MNVRIRHSPLEWRSPSTVQRTFQPWKTDGELVVQQDQGDMSPISNETSVGDMTDINLGKEGAASIESNNSRWTGKEQACATRGS